MTRKSGTRASCPQDAAREAGWKPAFPVVFCALLVWAAAALAQVPQAPPSPPQAALKYRAELTRIAHSSWGLDAPIPVFAAQIHQESNWNPLAVSVVGAKGMAQFMPATARWWCALNRLPPEECQPTNPVWAMRALIGYDRWLYARVRGANDFDKLWAALRSYNGGLGHWQKEAAIARAGRKSPSPLAPLPQAGEGNVTRAAIDAACGKARRSPVHCAENLGYPQRILLIHQPRYAAWGRAVWP